MTKSVEFMAIGGDIPHYGLLPEMAVHQWGDLQRAIREEWSSSNTNGKKRAIGLNGCLEKLSGSLLQAYRLRDHHDKLLVQAKSLINSSAHSAAMRGDEACTDFEGLLLQGRASLDRLAWQLTSHFGNSSASFRKVANVLRDFVAKNAEAEKLRSVIAEADSWFDGTFGQLDEPHALRDLVAHNHALTEGIVTCFAIHRVSTDKALIIDCEVNLPKLNRRFALFHTARESVKWLSYLVLNSEAILLRAPTIDVMHYESQWCNRAITLSDFVIKEPPGSPLTQPFTTVRAMTPDGFETTTANVKPALFDYAFIP